MRARRVPAAVSAALLAVLAVSACGASSSGSPVSSRPGSPTSRSTAPAETTPSASPSASAWTSGPPDNGEAAKPAAQVLADTRSALFTADAVHVTGHLHIKGQLVGLDMQFQGQDASGTIDLSAGPVGIVRTGGKVYLRASTAFWQKAFGPTGGRLAYRWLVVDAQQAAGLDDLTLPSLAASLSARNSPLQPQAARTQIEGWTAVQIVRQDGSTVAVAATGAPVPLEIASGGGTSSRNLAFRDYGKTMTIAAPPGAITPREAAKLPATSTT